MDQSSKVCFSCGGTGVIDVGDCERGVLECCPTCNGRGVEDEDNRD